MPDPDPGADGNLMAAGAVLVALKHGIAVPESIEAVTDADGNPTNVIEIGLSFLPSPYRLTVERVT